MKNENIFICSSCGNQTTKWYGKCPSCLEWNTITEEAVVNVKSKSTAKASYLEPLTLDEISSEDNNRIPTNIAEFDRVLGGGIVSGSIVLVGGEPGIGKSTLLLQVCSNLCNNKNVLYISGEESANQLKLRATRLGINTPNLYIAASVDIDAVNHYVNSVKPDFIIIDSVQTMYSSELSSAPGSVSQVRQVTLTLMQMAKQNQISIFVVGHVTKEGGIAGPKVLEHMVDCVLYFEGNANHSYRILRAVKNRFGKSGEIGMFKMSDKGLIEVLNPSLALLEGRPTKTSGSSIICSMEGSRPILAEIQALLSSTRFGMPRRTADGIDYNRVVLLMAVLEKRVGMNLSDQDAFVNVIGGIRVDEPASDLGICLALASGFRNFIIPDDTVLIGEVGLTGEVRAVSKITRRVEEVFKLGFKRVIIPKANKGIELNKNNLEILTVSTVIEALAILR